MPVFKDSRFKGSYLLLDESEANKDVVYLSPFRDLVITPQLEDFKIIFEQSMRVDILAKNYYGSEMLEWVIMDANPKYMSPFEIKVGDVIIIPNPERVRTLG